MTWKRHFELGHKFIYDYWIHVADFPQFLRMDKGDNFRDFFLFSAQQFPSEKGHSKRKEIVSIKSFILE